MNTRTLCLGILYFEDMTGYEINKLAAEGRFNHFMETSYGSIYPALNKLTEAGLVSWRQEAHDGKPTRKIYALTEAGREALFSALQEEPKADTFKSEFLFICLYSRYLSEQHMETILNTQLARLAEGLNRLSSAFEICEHNSSKFAIGYGVALHRAAIEYIKLHDHLLTDKDEASFVNTAEAKPNSVKEEHREI